MRICVFDLNSLFWRYANGSAKRALGEAAERTLGKVHQLAEGFDRIVHCCDAGKSWRAAIDPNYKVKRPEKDPAMVEQYCYVQETLAAKGHTVFVGREHPEHPGHYLEADDEIAAVVAWCKVNSKSVQIVTSDKDLLQLVDDEADIWCRNPEKNGPCKTDGVFAAMGVCPARVVDVLALGGDDTDGFKPFPGVGAESAKKLVVAYNGAIPAMHAILAGEPSVKLTAPQVTALRAGGMGALDRGLELASLLVLPGLDCARIAAEPVKREPPAPPQQPVLPFVAQPVEREQANEQPALVRPSPLPSTAPTVTEAVFSEDPMPEIATDRVLQRLAEPRAAAPLAVRAPEPRYEAPSAPPAAVHVETQLRTSLEIAGLVAALAAAQGEMGNAIREAMNPHLRKRYADLASVWHACRGPLSKHGLAVVQVVTGGHLVSRLMHASGQWIESDAKLALDTATGRTPVQALGSTLTYLRRYTLSGLVGVAPDDDDDGEGAR